MVLLLIVQMSSNVLFIVAYSVSLTNYYQYRQSLHPSVTRTLGEELHPTGCARSEGYYKIDPRDKTKYLPHLRRGKGETSDSKEVCHVHLCMCY